MARGGARMGAGRPKGERDSAAAQSANEAVQDDLTAMDYLLGVMRNPAQSQARRMRAAALLLPYMHTKPGGDGVKDAQHHGQAVAGRFSTPPPPKPH